MTGAYVEWLHDRAREGGRKGGLATGHRRKEDPELNRRLNEIVTVRDSQCRECGKITTYPGMRNHQKHSGHQGIIDLSDLL